MLSLQARLRCPNQYSFIRTIYEMIYIDLAYSAFLSLTGIACREGMFRGVGEANTTFDGALNSRGGGAHGCAVRITQCPIYPPCPIENLNCFDNSEAMRDP